MFRGVSAAGGGGAGTCSRVRVMSALASLGQAEIQALIAEERMLDMSCDYCCTHYQVASAELRGLVQDS